MVLITSSIIDTISSVLGEAPHGFEFLYYAFAIFLLVFVFHLLEHIFEIFFSKFYK